MKKYAKIAAAGAVIPFLGSCAFGASIDTLMTPPKLSIEQEQIYKALTDAAGESVSLKYPKSGRYLSAFIIEDIDGDGGNEAVVFYEKSSLAAPENTLRINILDRSDNGKWWSVYDTPAEGAEIEQVIISKLGDNERLNLIIGSSLINRSEKTAAVYSYYDGKLERTFSGSYSFMDVTDLDDDDENEFLLLKGYNGESPAAVESYKLDSEGRYHKYSEKLSGGFTEFDSVSYGKLKNGRKGLYIDAISGMGYIQTDIVYMDENGMQTGFSSADESYTTQRPSGCRSFDIDGDGELEIPVQELAPGYINSPEGEQLWLTKWYTVNEKGKKEIKYTSYYSVGDGYLFIFPEKWRDRVTVQRDAINDEIVVCEYEDEETGKELLRIYCAEDEASREDRISTGYMVLRTRGETTYLAAIPEDPEGESEIALTDGEAAIGFRYMGES